jgi:hypothetical protein
MFKDVYINCSLSLSDVGGLSSFFWSPKIQKPSRRNKKLYEKYSSSRKPQKQQPTTKHMGMDRKSKQIPAFSLDADKPMRLEIFYDQQNIIKISEF